MNVRKLSLSILAMVCALTSFFALGGTSASAFLKHEYVSQITGTPEGPFRNACAFTIDPASQDLYVANFGNNAIDVFEPSGTSGYTYKSHFNGPVSGPEEDLFNSGAECDIAVSDVTGDLYVESSAPSPKVFVFDSLGSYLEELNGSTTPNEYFYGTVHVAVDQSSGDVYVFDQFHNVVDRFNKANEYKSQLAIPNTSYGNGAGLAVDSHGVIYVGNGNEHLVQEYNSSEVKIGEFADAEPNSITVDSEGNVYVASFLYYKKGGVVDEFDSSGALEGQTIGTSMGRFGNPRVAVNAIGDPYVLSGSTVDVFGPAILVPDVSTQAPSKLTSTSVTLNGTVNAKGTQISSCEFEYGLTTAYGQTAACEPTPAGSSPVTVSVNVKGLQAGTEYHYRLVAKNPNGYNESEDATFFTPGPQVQGESFSEVGLHRATVNAQIDPEGLPTTYTIEYGTSEAYGSTTPAANVGAGTEFIDIVNLLGVSSESVLQSGTTYHFRVVANNANGTRYGSDVTFATLSGFTGLPDGRGYELVTPLANADGDVYVPEPPSQNETGLDELVAPSPTRVSADGNAVEYVADRLATGGIAGDNTYVAMRDPGGGWSPIDLSTPGFDGLPFEALFADEFSNSGTGLVPAGSHILRSDTKGLFDSVGDRLFPVSVLPEGEVVTDATFGSVDEEPGFVNHSRSTYDDISHVVSADGSRIFWTDREEGLDKEHLFVREDDSRTIPVSAGAAQFRVASLDGRYVFYTEQEKLLRFDVENGSREELADAGVLGVVGVNETGEDGAYVYFVANSVLGNGPEHGAHQGNCTFSVDGRGSCNLYVDHDGVTAFIAALHQSDIYEIGRLKDNAIDGVGVESLAGRTAEVSADGEAVVFESSASLTGYENDGHDEAFVYNAGSGRLSCVSCNPTGVPATGPVGPHSGGLSAVLRGSSSELWAHRWISEDGTRVFFESLEGLVAQATNGERNVYEWEQDGTGSCENIKGCVYLLSGGTSSDNSYFLDASASGNDVFMITRAELTPQDDGDTYEVYDARVGTKESAGEPACTGTGCQGLPAGPPLFATPSSVTFAGVGNFSPGTALATKAKTKSGTMSCRKGTHKHSGKCVKSRAAKKAKAGKSIHGKGSK